MIKFINIINDNGLMTKFISNIFNYCCFNDFNYIFRLIEKDFEIIIDIYDNVSDTKFNRYIFSFFNDGYMFLDFVENDIFVKRISVLNMVDCDDKLLKLAYLFNIDTKMMIEYANSFLDKEFVKIISDIIK